MSAGLMLKSADGRWQVVQVRPLPLNVCVLKTLNPCSMRAACCAVSSAAAEVGSSAISETIANNRHDVDASRVLRIRRVARARNGLGSMFTFSSQTVGQLSHSIGHWRGAVSEEPEGPPGTPSPQPQPDHPQPRPQPAPAADLGHAQSCNSQGYTSCVTVIQSKRRCVRFLREIWRLRKWAGWLVGWRPLSPIWAA